METAGAKKNVFHSATVHQPTLSQHEAAKDSFGRSVAPTPVEFDLLASLGQSINRMAARLAGFVIGQKRFLGDIAHELCAPIARTQMALGILEQRADDKHKAYVEDLREEVQHMSSLVNELLSFSKASLGATTAKPVPVRLRSVAEDAVRRESTEGAQVRLDVPVELSAVAEPELLVRALANLLRNAIRYAGQAGPITISTRQEGQEILLTVADCGLGVPEPELARIFDPFYRLDASRDAATGGVGLGLAIVKTCVESCRGSVSCRNRQPSGLEVTIRLPAAAEPSASGR
jgi:two-component system sensor histidine kinase CpxA